MWHQGNRSVPSTVSESKSSAGQVSYDDIDKKFDHEKRDTDSGCLSGGIYSSEQLYSEDDHQISTPKLEKIVEPVFDSGVVSCEFTSSEQEKSEEMIVERPVDSGVNEWFCKLSIQENSEPINNLDHATTFKQPVEGKCQKSSPTWEQIYAQNDEGETQLHLCVIVGYENYMDTLIQLAPHKCFLDIQNDFHQTALHLAVLTSQPKMVQHLVRAGAKVSVRDSEGNTALHLACLHGEVECAREILSNKCEAFDLQQWNYNGETCVHLAAKNNHIEILRYLVQAGADINAREGKSGLTALHIAIEQSNEEMANYLLDECPKLSIESKTYAGLTAYQLAAIQHNQMLVSSLMQKGAETISPPESDSDSDYSDDEIAQYYGANKVFNAFNGPSTIHVA